jgi:queuine/archaeosine tRNA-ribosyltransferase
MLIATDYFMGRDRAYPQHLTDEIRTNAAELLGRVNLLLTWALRDNVRPAIDQRTISHVASGWRPP